MMVHMTTPNSNGSAEILRILAENREKLSSFGVRRIGLFGSALRGELTSDSDIDVLVEFEKGSEGFTNLMGLYHFLHDMFNRRIDIVTPDGISPYMAPRILEEVEYVGVG